MINFESKAGWASKVVPVRATFSEALSRCYALTLDLFAAGADLDLSEALNRKASVTLEPVSAGAPRRRKITGIVSEMALAGVLPAGEVWYRLVLVPRLELLDLTTRSRVFCTDQPAPVGTVITEVLDKAEGVQFGAADHAMRLQSTAYPQRDMVVQYRESDLAFLSRLAENAGIFYFFEEGEESERVVFGDRNEILPWLGGSSAASTLAYRPSTGIADRAPAIRAASAERRLVPNSVKLNERYYARPEIVLNVVSAADSSGVGLLSSDETEFYHEAGWGQALADIRAQEASVNRLVLSGESDSVALAAGTVFTLAHHPASRLDGAYIVVSAEHSAWESAEGIAQLPGPGPKGAGYWNRFTAIPRATPYRPARLTPRPHIPGLMRAVIDGVDDARANIDALGCYRIKFPFDAVKRAPGRSSSPVRLVTPYGGPSEGFHFPLRARTQVMIAFQNGDPDRPIIVGPLYDAGQKSVVTQRNRTANVISTASGITITMNDGTAPGGG